MRRKVLVVEEESSIRNLIYVLLGALECESDVACCGPQALAMVERENFDAVLLDLRSSSLAARQLVSGIQQIRPSLIGRVLYITGEVSDPGILDLIEQNCVTRVRRGQLLHDVWDRLRQLLAQPEPPSRYASKPRLQRIP